MQIIDQLIEAARNNNLFKLVSLINDGVEVNQVNSHGISPLIQAASSGNWSAVEILLQAGANLELTNKFGTTAQSAA
ncbi:MAG: ankyrin repeat domain-containing protein, partial [Neisseriales bacterium]